MTARHRTPTPEYGTVAKALAFLAGAGIALAIIFAAYWGWWR